MNKSKTLKISMQDLLNIIDSVSEVNLELKVNVIKIINSFDPSDLSVTDIRIYIEYIKNITKTDIMDKVDCYNRLISKLNVELGSRPFKERFPEIVTDIDKMLELATSLLESNRIHDIQIKDIQNVNIKRDKQLEKFVNDSVVKYLGNGNIVASGYKYITEDGCDGELDGMVNGKDEDGKNTVVFIETKSDMNSGWKVAQMQMNRTIAYWRFLKELISDDVTSDILEKYTNDIKTLRVKEFKDYKIRCAFGANEFSQKTVTQFKQFKRYHWLKIVKLKDDGFQVVRNV